MIRIGLISDTHGYLDNAVFTYFNEVDEIWHAGDFGSMEVVRALQEFKLLRGVWGNIDNSDIKEQFPEFADFQVEGVNTLMIHIGGYPGRYSPTAKTELTRYKPQLFISGHSHILKIMYDDKLQCLHMNSGAAGQHGWHHMRTLIRFSIDGNKIQNCEVIELGTRGIVK